MTISPHPLSVTFDINILLLCLFLQIFLPSFTLFHSAASLPVSSEVFVPSPFGAGCATATASGTTFVHKDDENNVYFDMYTIKGEDNRIMYAKNGVLVVSICPSDDIYNTTEHHLWKFIATVLEVDLTDIDILMFPGEVARRVVLKNGRLSEEDCSRKIKEYLQPYMKGADPSSSRSLLFPYTPLAVYAQNNTNKADSGDWKYYNLKLKKDENLKSKVKDDESLRKRLLKMKPFYEKDPSLMAQVFRDLGVQNKAVFRGRLMPGSPVKPVLDDYRGPNKLKLVRRILQGTDRSRKFPRIKARLEMSHPVPDLIMLDYLSPDKQKVVSRRVLNPLFRNETVDLVEELEYTEV